MSNTLERLYERRQHLLRIAQACAATPDNAETRVIVHNDRVRRDAEKELFEVQTLIDAAQS